MFLAGDDAFGYFCPWHKLVGVEVAKFETRFKQTHYALVDLLFGYLSGLHRIGQVAVFASALHVGAAYNGLGRCRRRVFRHSVSARFPKVAYSSAVAYHKPFEAPFVAQYLL